MSHRSRVVRFAPVLAALLGLALPLAALADEAQLDAIAERVAELRELPPLPGIDNAFITADELRARLPAMLDEDYPPADAEAESRAYAALGLIPPGTDLRQLYEHLLGEQVAGYYDPRTDQMFVIGDGGALGPEEEFTYAHEVVHALQDANLDLGDVMESTQTANDDEALAVAALFEGDATAASFAYLLTDPSLAAAVAFAAPVDSAEFDTAPAAIAISLVFPYLAGQEFVSALYDEGGWQAVNDAYARLPVSTAQIMHPEKYLANDAPTPIALPDPVAALGPDWSLVNEDTLGELGVALLLANLQPGQGLDAFGGIALPIPARNAAAGWDGDRFALWSDGDQDVLILRSAWDSESDARAFARALQARTQERFGGTYATTAPADLTMTAPDIATRIVFDGSEVFYAQAPTPELAARALEAMR
ncbi:MAG: hypothetical protein IT337_06595 [Thermomicrobiales bacterium]|nr:hypothetical protein [Thermomicrobiales bacterium]